MSSQKFDFLFSECLGAVTILTVDNVVFQGVVRRCDEDSRKSSNHVNVVVAADEFIFLELKCEPAIIDDGQLVTIFPALFSEDDIVKINVRNIVAVGPSNGCLDDTSTGGTGNTKNTKNTKNSNSNSNNNSKG